MSKHSWFGQHWKLILNWVTVAALVVLIIAIRQQLGDTLRNLAHVNAWILLLMIPIELLNYHAQARLYQRLFSIVGNKLSYKYLYRTSLELNFVNHVFPSGGVTGVSYFGIRLRDGDSLSSGKATLVQIMKLGLTFLSFEILIIFGLFSLAIMGRVSSLVILVAGSLSTLLVVGTFGFIYVVRSEARIKSFFTSFTEGLNKIIHIVRPHYPETINIVGARKVFDDFHENYEAIEQNVSNLKQPFWYAFLANVTEVMALYIVYLAFGKPVNVGAVILAYAIANFAGFVSVLPGGVGIYEALMTAVLASTGVPAAVSLPVTIMYRVANTLIQIPPGYYYYQKSLRGTKQLPGQFDG